MKNIGIFTYIKLFLLVTSLIGLSLAANAQIIKGVKSSVKRGDDFFAVAQYQNALAEYRDAFGYERNNTGLMLKIGECYRLLDRPEEAERMYRMFINDRNFLSTQDARIQYNFGLILESNGKYEEARDWFELYSTVRPDDKMVMAKLENLTNIEQHYQDSSNYQVLDIQINTRYNDTDPVFFQNGIVFVSDRKYGANAINAFNDSIYYKSLYFSEIDNNGMLAEPVRFYPGLITNAGAGAVTFDPDGKLIYFTRTVQQGVNTGNFNLYIGQKADESDSWARIRPFEYNSVSENYSVLHPTIAQNGAMLYFASDMPGGFGGFDLYRCKRNENGGWQAPENLGDRINTSESELYPYVFQDSVLYFSSRGHRGLGGLDVFEFSMNNPKSVPVNLGFPINTNKNDFGFTLSPRGHLGYFTSNREDGKGGDDIYMFRRNVYFTGRILSQANQQPLANTWVLMTNTRNNLVNGAKTRENGEFKIQVEIDEVYELTATRPGYANSSLRRISTYGKLENLASQDIVLKPEAIFFTGTVKNRTSGTPIGNAVITLLDKRKEVTYKFNTAPNGEYAIKLAPNTFYSLRADVLGFLPAQVEINTFVQNAGTFEQVFELRAIPFDQLVTLSNTNYSPLKTDVGPINEEELSELALYLLANPHITAEIIVHTDTRGNEGENLRLSQNRSKYLAVRLSQQGIDASRLVAIGKGEAEPVIDCPNENNCTETEHQKNRRVQVILKNDKKT